MRFFHPEPAPLPQRIYPAFIPFAGCPGRCVFCAQHAQTGAKNSEPVVIEDVLQSLEANLRGLNAQHRAKESEKTEPERLRPPLELAFYGGTFTALPQADQTACLNLSARLKAEGLIARLRCSTRPDAVSLPQLRRLKEHGLDCVELGIQSFSAAPLAASRRGYGPEAALTACSLVQEAGLELGIQLMPGMPGMHPEHFREDMHAVLRLKPSFLRLYPCLVLEGTELAEEWRQGRFTPWQIEECCELLSEALLDAWGAGIKVIRMGLAPEASLAPLILAGPEHPALGQILRSRALLAFMRKQVKLLNTAPLELLNTAPLKLLNTAPQALHAPRRVQGEFFGHSGDLIAPYAALGLHKGNVFWWDSPYFELN